MSELGYKEEQTRDEHIEATYRKFVSLLESIREVSYWYEGSLETAYFNCSVKSLEKSYLLFEEAVTDNKPETGAL